MFKYYIYCDCVMFSDPKLVIMESCLLIAFIYFKLRWKGNEGRTDAILIIKTWEEKFYFLLYCPCQTIKEIY